MKLVELKCPNCSGQLKVNPEKEFITCGYCHTEFKVDDEINRIEIHKTYTDEAKLEEVRATTEIYLKEMERDKKKNIARIIGLIICVIMAVVGYVFLIDSAGIIIGMMGLVGSLYIAATWGNK